MVWHIIMVCTMVMVVEDLPVVVSLDSEMESFSDKEKFIFKIVDVVGIVFVVEEEQIKRININITVNKKNLKVKLNVVFLFYWCEFE